MKNCGYCGRENSDEAVYCSECGTQEFVVTSPAASVVHNDVEVSDAPNGNRFRNHPHSGFCEKCLEETIEVECDGVESIFSRNGPKFFDQRAECPVCASVVRDVRQCLFYVPVIYVGSYRIKYLPSGGFLSRKIGETYSLSDTPIMLQTASLCEAGDPEEAIRRYTRIVALFPDSSAGLEAGKAIEALRANRPQSIETILGIENAENAIDKLVERVVARTRSGGRGPSRSEQAVVDIKWLDQRVYANGFQGWISNTCGSSIVRTLDSLAMVGCHDISRIVVAALAELGIDPRVASDAEMDARVGAASGSQRKRLGQLNNDYHHVARDVMEDCRRFALTHRNEFQD